jgi:ATP-binding cassette subfamily B protein
MRESLRSAAWLFRMSWRQHRAKTATSLILMVSGAVAAPLMALSLRWLTNAAVSGDAATAGWAGIAVATCAMGVLTLSHFAHLAYFELSEIDTLTTELRLIALSSGSAGIEHQERAEYADRLAVLEQEVQQIQNGIYAALTLSGLVVAISLTGLLLAMVNPVLLLLPMVAVPPLMAGRRAQLVLDRSREDAATGHLGWPRQGVASLRASKRDPDPLPRTVGGSDAAALASPDRGDASESRRATHLCRRIRGRSAARRERRHRRTPQRR